MNVELNRIWKESAKTILFVTHSISEAVFLGTKVIVLTARPARMAGRIAIELAEPRTLETKTQEDFGAYSRRIYELLGMT
jgi:NitT/TauT family transport system ATP-binding protein